jgi:hypothetical protein
VAIHAIHSHQATMTCLLVPVSARAARHVRAA